MPDAAVAALEDGKLSVSRPAPAELLVVHTDILSSVSARRQCAISLNIHPFCTNSNTKEAGKRRQENERERDTHAHTEIKQIKTDASEW